MSQRDDHAEFDNPPSVPPGARAEHFDNFKLDEAYRVVSESMRRQASPAPDAANVFGAEVVAGGSNTPDSAAGPGVLRLLIADDQALVRSGFRMILSSYENFSVVGEARDGQEAVELARMLKPDVVLMDIRMPALNGIEATRAITADAALDQVRVLILTTFDIDEYVYDALAAGAGGFLLKDAEPDDIASAVRVVAAGDALIQPSVMRRLVETFVRSRGAGEGALEREGATADMLAPLTEREREILAQVARGLTNDDIAGVLIISPATVKTHLARIMAKLDAHDRAQLVVKAYEAGLVKPGSA